jgi:hypothetical protein
MNMVLNEYKKVKKNKVILKTISNINPYYCKDIIPTNILYVHLFVS